MGSDLKEENSFNKPAGSRAPKSIEQQFSAVDFLEHIAPYYLPCASYVVLHCTYLYMGGNVLLVLLFAYVINFPYYRWTSKIP